MEGSKVWRQEDFSDFIKGTFGNAGQNIYVSRAGVLQRIHHFDINADGYMDLVFCNSHDAIECPPAYVYQDALGTPIRSELPTGGARSAAVADLNGDGYDDLVIGMWFNGVTADQNAVIYYGSSEGWSEKRVQFLPAPQCRSIAIADFDGDGKPDLAFLTRGVVRLFAQTEIGFEPERFTDFEIGSNETEGELEKSGITISVTLPEKLDQIEAADLNGDGYAELITRFKNGEVRVYWGDKDGIDLNRYTRVPVEIEEINPIETTPPRWSKEVFPDPKDWEFFYEWATYFENPNGPNGQMQTPQVRVVYLDTKPHIFVARVEQAVLVPVESDGSFEAPLILPCQRPMAIAVGDINGDGYEDVFLACQEETESDCEELSWIYWGSENGFDLKRRTSLQTFRACDVSVADLDGDGCDDIVIGQGFQIASWTHESLVYRGTKTCAFEKPVQLTGHNCVRALVGRPSGDDNPVVVLANRMEGSLQGKQLPAYAYFGGPDGFTPERLRELPNWGATDAVCCDVNDDGHTDVILANCLESHWERSEVYVLLNSPTGFPREPSICLPYPAYAVCCADLNRDGYLDIVTDMFGDSELHVFYGNADGFKREPKRIRMECDGKTYQDPRWLYLADFNNDGWLDLFVSQISDDRSFILWGGPDGFGMDRCQVLSVQRGTGCQAADLSGNGYPDLVIGGSQPSPIGPHNSFLYIYWNGPAGLSESNRTILPANAASSISVADFNNDGLLDIFISNYWGKSERDIPSCIYWNRKGRGFRDFDRTELPTHSASGSIAADFNEDGWVDIAIAYHKVDGRHIGYSGVWWNGPDGFSEKNVTTLPTRGPHGMIWVDPGNIADRSEEEHYTSCVHKLPDGANVTGMDWEAELQVKTWVKAQLRFAKTEADLAEAPWQGPEGEGSWFDNEKGTGNLEQTGPWVQYRLALGAKNSGNTPRITAVNIHYHERTD